MQGSKLAQQAAARILGLGFPGSGKTGSLACLVNAGLKMRVLAFDKEGNMQPLLQYIDPDKLDLLDIQFFEDQLKAGTGTIEVVGRPQAFASALKAMDHWTYTDEETGEVTDLGHSKDWGPDTVVVVDSITSLGDAAKRRAMALGNRTTLNMRDTDWGVGMGEQEAFIEKLASSRNRFHLIVLSHLKLIGPKETRKGDDEITKEVKEQQADLIETRYYPSALGRALPPLIGRHFSTTVLVEKEYKPGGKVVQVIRTLSRPELDLKLPTRQENLDKLPIADGMLTIFNATTPGVEACLAAAARQAEAVKEELPTEPTEPALQSPKETETWQRKQPARKPPPLTRKAAPMRTS